MRIKIFIALTVAVILPNLVIAQQADNTQKVMDGFPPSRESQVTFQNYRDYPFSQWSFRNIGAPLHILMVPRSGNIHTYSTSNKISVGNTLVKDSAGNTQTFEGVFKDNHADGVIVLQNGN